MICPRHLAHTPVRRRHGGDRSARRHEAVRHMQQRLKAQLGGAACARGGGLGGLRWEVEEVEEAKQAGQARQAGQAGQAGQAEQAGQAGQAGGSWESEGEKERTCDEGKRREKNMNSEMLRELSIFEIFKTKEDSTRTPC